MFVATQNFNARNFSTKIVLCKGFFAQGCSLSERSQNTVEAALLDISNPMKSRLFLLEI